MRAHRVVIGLLAGSIVGSLARPLIDDMALAAEGASSLRATATTAAAETAALVAKAPNSTDGGRRWFQRT